MQLNVSVGGSIAATTTPARAAAPIPDAGTMLSPVEPVAGVTVALSPAAGAMLEGYEQQRDVPEPPARGNPLGGPKLSEEIDAVLSENAGNADADPLDANSRSMQALNEAIREESADREKTLNELQRSAEREAPAKAAAPGGAELSEDEKRVVEELRARDAEVRAHEMAHVAAAGGLAGAPSYSYQTGPDGKRYAIGGSVSIDTSSGNDPQETLSKAQRIRSAAMAPAEPSGQDRAVAARATQMEVQARNQLTMERRAEQQQAMQPADSAPVEGAEGEVPRPSLPRLQIDPSGGPRAPISAGSAVLASPAQGARLSAFHGGTAADAQLYSPPERAIEASYISAARGQRAS